MHAGLRFGIADHGWGLPIFVRDSVGVFDHLRFEEVSAFLLLLLCVCVCVCVYILLYYYYYYCYYLFIIIIYYYYYLFIIIFIITLLLLRSHAEADEEIVTGMNGGKRQNQRHKVFSRTSSTRFLLPLF